MKLRGFRIELGEIEAVLRRYPAVVDAVVLARQDAPDDKRLVAYVVLDEAGSRDARRELRGFVKEKLPEYMVPSAFVVLPALPLTPNGKVDRRALLAPKADAVVHEAYTAPRGPVEEALAGFFVEVLKMADVGAHDDFFVLGGHSLLATQVMARVRRTFGVELPLRTLFEAPTPAELGRRVDDALRVGTTTMVPPLERVPREGPVRLSFGQERLWFLDQLTPGDTTYVVPVLLRLAGRVDRAALRCVLRELVLRHEALRTTYALVDGHPVGIVHERMDPVLAIARIEVPEAERAAAVRREVAAEMCQSFDLGAGPLLRARLIELADDDHALLLTMHHIVSDGWTVGILRAEVRALYGAFREGKPSPLAEPGIQYADYAAWQRSWLVEEVLGAQLSYWKTQLRGAPHALDLPGDHARPSVASGRGSRRSFALPAELSQALARLGQREGATLFMTLLATFYVLLYRYTRQRDLVVGTPIANRTHAETEAVVGFFVNTLALRADLVDDDSFRALLALVREMCLGAYAHQDMPFERLVQELAPERDLSRTPLFQVMFVLQNAPREMAERSGASPRGGLEAVEVGTAKFDLTLSMAESPRGLLGSIEYATDLFEPVTIDRMVGHLGVLFDGIAAAPEARLFELPIMTGEERHRLLVEWNGTDAPYPRDATVHGLFEAQAARTPDALAVVSGGRALTYGELDARANLLAGALRVRGVGPGVPAAVCTERSIEGVVGLLAVLKAGGAYVAMDPTHPEDRLRYMVEDTRAVVVLTQARLAQRLAGVRAPVWQLDAGGPAIDAGRDGRVANVAGPDDLAYIIYTSGSTGTPKGVELRHGGLVNLVTWHVRAYALGAGDRCTHLASPGFDASVWEIWPPLLAGATLLIPDEETRMAPAALVAWLVEQCVTVAFLPTPSCEAVLAQPWPAASQGASALRAMLTGGDRLGRRPPPGLPFRLFNHYGPTEYTVVTSAGVVEPEGEGAPTIGRPIANTHVYLLDAHAQPVPVGVLGELYVGGAGLARGYLGRPELTARSFVPNPVGVNPVVLYRTGDLARWRPNGELEFAGRADEQVKVRGFRIELGEIEAVLSKHPALREAVVVAREDAPGEKRLVAYVVFGDGKSIVSNHELRAFVREKLPEYMAPSAYVMLPALPLTANGKVDRRALPVPGVDALAQRAYLAPRGPVEEAIAGFFIDVLKVADVGAHDGFFALGGHSLLATQVMARIHAAFGVELTLRVLFEAPTVAELAKRVEEAVQAGERTVAPPLVRVARRELPELQATDEDMAQALLDLAGPSLDELDPEAGDDEMQRVVDLAVLAWNLPLVEALPGEPGSRREAMREELGRRFERSPELRESFERIVEERRTRFDHLRRLVVSATAWSDAGEVHLEVATTELV